MLTEAAFPCGIRLSMRREKSLFSYSGNDASDLYCAVRDGDHECCRRVRSQCEELWDVFAEHADRHFLREFALSFHQRWFEMYLTVAMTSADLDVQCRKPGPDILVKREGRRIWIEAVCATMGEEGRPDSVPRTHPGAVRKEPMRQVVLRLRNSIQEKAKKFQAYIGNGILDHGDHAVIAVNGCEVSSRYPDECLLRSLYGVGDMVAKFDRASGGIADWDHLHVPTIRKTSGAEVGVQPFIDGSMKQISAAIGSWTHAFNCLPNPEMDLVLYPNLTGASNWPPRMLPLPKEWTFHENDGGWSGRKTKNELGGQELSCLD